MLSWDEYEIQLIQEWCQKNDVQLLQRSEYHFDISKNDLMKLLKDDILYRGNWKNDKPKYQIITPTYVYWEKICAIYWTGLQKLGDWINCICTLRNDIDIPNITEFNLNQWKFTIWMPHDNQYIGFDIYQSKIGFRPSWDKQTITWKDLLQINTKTAENFTEHIVEEIEPLLELPPVEPLANEPPATELPFQIQDELNETVDIQEDKPEEEDKPVIIKWDYHKIQNWLLKGCPRIVHKKETIEDTKNLPNTNTNTNTNTEEETSITEEKPTEQPLIPLPKIISVQSYHHWILQKNQFLHKYWSVVQWGRKQKYPNLQTTICLT